MSLIVALFYIANAPTLAASLSDLSSSNATSVLVSNSTASTKQRSTWEILWTCLATIFACTWVSIHPNIPSSKDGRIRIAFQRLELMVWAILTPEMIIFWAMRQWRHARVLTKVYEGTVARYHIIFNSKKKFVDRLPRLDHHPQSLSFNGRVRPVRGPRGPRHLRPYA